VLLIYLCVWDNENIIENAGKLDRMNAQGKIHHNLKSTSDLD
jgi:hypothetical protein